MFLFKCECHYVLYFRFIILFKMEMTGPFLKGIKYPLSSLAPIKFAPLVQDNLMVQSKNQIGKC